MKKNMCALTFLLLTALALTGCRGSSSEQPAETAESTVSQTETTETTDETTSCSEPETAAFSADSTEDTTVTESSTDSSGSTTVKTTVPQDVSGDMKAAKKVMEQYLTAVANGNRSQVLKTTNLEWYAELMAAVYSDMDMSRQDFVDYLYSALSEDSGKTGRIVRCGENKKLLRDLRNELSNMQRDIGELEDEDRKMAETILERYRIPDHLFVFQVDTGEEGSAGIEYYTVSMYGNELLVDLTANSALGKYTQTSRVTTANSAAKAVMDSMNDTLKLLAPQTDEVKKIDGTHEFSVAEFRSAKEPDGINGRSDLFEALCYQAYEKAHTSLSSAQRVMITVKNGKVTAAAVQMKSIEDPVTGEDMSVFGSAPREVGVGELIGVLTLESVLEKAAK